MRWRARVRSTLRGLFRASDVERDVDQELRAALEELTARHEARGLDPTAARRAASQELDGAHHIRETVREKGAMHRLETLWRDIKYGIGALGRAPGFSSTVIVVLALGIGATTAIFSVVNAMVLSPLPYRDSDRLVFVWQDLTRAGYPRAPLAGPELVDLRERSRLFESFGGIWANTVALTGDAEPEQLRIGRVTANFFEVLGARAAIGRVFTEADEAQTAAPSILLSAGVWRRRYASDPAIIGRSIQVNGRPLTVVGVMPDDFRLLLPPDSAIPDDQQAWLLLGRQALAWPRQQQYLRVVGRLAPGVRLEDGQREIAAISEAVGKAYPAYGTDGATFYGIGLQAEAVRDLKPAFLALLAAVSVLLLIACVNLAGLFAARAAAHQREIAVRMAIGASRARVFRQGLIDALLLSLAGGAAGFGMAHAMLAGLLSLRPEALSRIDATRLDVTVFLFALGVSLACGLAFAIGPLLQAFNQDVARALSSGGRAQAGTGGRGLRRLLVTAQAALSVMLLVVAGLLARGFHQLQTFDPGFSADGITTFKLSLAGPRYRSIDAIQTFSRELRAKLGELPGVESVGAISHLPYDTVPNWGTPYLPENAVDDRDAGVADARAVTPGYFETVGARLVEGRWFDSGDTLRAMPVAIVDTMLVNRMWPGQSAIGKRLVADPGTTGTPGVAVTIVGVVSHLRHRDVTRDLREQMYFPAEQSLRNPMAYALRTSGSVDQSAAIRRAVAALDPGLPVYDVRPLSSYTGSATAMRAFSTVVAATFAVSALLLACLGVYGVTAYSVRQRRREFGLRLALGASTRQMAGLVLREGGAVALAGALIGAGLALWASSLLSAQIYGVSPRDPATYAASLALIVAAVIAASWLPARRAARTSPLESLRLD